MTVQEALELILNATYGEEVRGAIHDAIEAIDGVAENLIPLFSSTTSYVKDDLVFYNDDVYRFTKAHTGAWNAADVEQTTVADELRRISEVNRRILAAFPTDTASGSIATFTDGADNIPVKSLTAQIMPQQDLNGFDYPWPAGGGKNLIPYPYVSPSGTVSGGITFTTDAQGRISASGTTTGSVLFSLMDATVLPAGTYTISVDKATSELNLVLRKNGSSNWSTRAAGSYTFTANGTDQYDIRLSRSTVSLAVSFSGVGIQLEIGSIATDYAPYSNVCPITGWTGLNVNRYGNEYAGTYTPAAGQYLRPTGSVMTVAALPSGDPERSIIVPVLPSTKYHVKSGIPGTMRAGGFASVPAASATTGNFATATDTENPVELEITTSATAQYLFIQFFIDADISARGANLTDALTGFSYGAVTTYTVNWTDEVFAGTATYMGGGKWSIRATHIAIPSLSTMTWNFTAAGSFFNVGVGWLHLDGSKRDTLICNKYKTLTPAASVLDDKCIGLTLGGDSLRIRDSRYTDPTEFKATLSDVVCYAPLLEAYYPSPVIVDGPDPETLLGDNNVWADTGDIDLIYRADPSKYIEKKFAELPNAQGVEF